ncbi:kinocilin [Chiloscyllium punctatum]|uniref:kinocilin n=1 Tax=Chiloscyllium punctatum TaxID=137246 RepID=UPI003B63462C
MISIFPFIRTWLEYNRVLPFLGNLRIHPQQPNNHPELASVSYTREETSKQDQPKNINLPEKKTADINSPDEGTSAETPQPDIIQKGKFIQPS